MKQIRYCLILVFFLGLMNPITAQKKGVVKGRYNGVWVTMEYIDGGDAEDDIISLKYGDVDLKKKIDQLNGEIAKLQSKNISQNSSQSQSKNKTKNSKTDSEDLQRLKWKWELDSLAFVDQLDSLRTQRDSLVSQVQMLKESLVNINRELVALREKDSVLSGKDELLNKISVGEQHIGVYYSLGCPWLFSPKNGGTPIWSRQMTLSHQLGLYWGSRSLLRNGSLSLGAGLEYSRMRFAAGMGQSSFTLSAVDNDNDVYTAHLTYRNVEERATVRYLSIPLTLSFGQPYNDRISGYGQITFAPSVCVSSSLNTAGYYDLEGYYSQWDLTLTEFQHLGFGPDQSIKEDKAELKVNGFLFTGRLAGGVYVPLCRIKQHETSPWVLKLGVKLDYSISPAAKQAEQEDKLSQVVFNATDYINQNNFLSGGRFSFLNPGVEVGIMYILGTKNR